MPTSFTTQPKAADLVKHEYPDHRFTREFVEVSHSADQAVGKVGTLHQSNGDEIEGGDLTGTTEVRLCLDYRGEGKQSPVLVRGPALVNRAVLPTADTSGAAYGAGFLEAALKLQNILVIDEPATQETQTT